MLRKKDSYPYEWVDSYRKFIYPRLPPKENFYSSIDDGKRGKGNGHISYSQYLHLNLVWKRLRLKTFKDFHNHYLKKDVLLLVDVFEDFISGCLKYYNLDPCHYFSAPGLSWDAILKMTTVELEKISDADMHIFIEKCMREGISCNSKRYSEANNEYCPNYDKIKLKIYISYHDVNNMYWGAMSEYLPYGGFKWVKVNNETVKKILNKSGISLHGYLLEVHLHDYHNDYSMVPDKVKIENGMLSPYSLEVTKEYDIKTGGINKLAPNLMPKKNYGVHYRNLQYDLSKGLILTKVHRI